MARGRRIRQAANDQLSRAMLLLVASLHCGGGAQPSSVPGDAGSALEGPAPDAPEPAADQGALGADASSSASGFGFQRDVYPLFVTYCGECHSVNGPYHDIASPDLAIAYSDSVEFAARVLARIRQGNMPPACVFDDAACVPPESLLSIERWVDAGMPE